MTTDSAPSEPTEPAPPPAPAPAESAPPPAPAPAGPTKPPGIVTFIGILLLINATIAAVAAVAAFIALGQGDSVFTDTALWTVGIVESMVAILGFIVASFLMNGSKSARGLVAIVVGLRIIATVIVMLTHHEGGFLATGLLGAVIGVLILWALYVHEASVEYFEDSTVA